MFMWQNFSEIFSKFQYKPLKFTQLSYFNLCFTKTKYKLKYHFTGR